MKKINWGIENPPKVDTFHLPDKQHLALITPGDCVKLIFAVGGQTSERMWLEVSSMNGKYWRGILVNYPCSLPIKYGAEVLFKPDQIIDIDFQKHEAE